MRIQTEDERSVIFMFWYQELSKSLDVKNEEIKNKLVVVKQDYKEVIKNKEADFYKKLVEFEKLFKRKKGNSQQTGEYSI